MIRTAVVAAALVFVPYFSFPNAGAHAASPGMILAGDVDTCGAIGVSVRRLSTAMAEGLGLTHGAVFSPPQPDSPAAHAHIQAGDVVTAINGRPLAHAREFNGEIAKRAPNTRIYLTVWRSRQMMNVPVVLGSGKCPSGRGST